jgi:hypothetical protein
MNEFLFLALVVIYLAISYVPVSGAPKPTLAGQPDERLSHSNAGVDADRR